MMSFEIKIKEELDAKLIDAFDSKYPNYNGTLKLGDGASYQGTIINGEAQGYGSWIRDDGIVFSGNFVDSDLNGSGSISIPDGRLYEGVFKEGILIDGILYVNNRKFYQGGFDEHFRPSGKNGIMWFDAVSTGCDGYRYEGEFHDARPNGQGTFFYPDGGIYCGECKNGYAHGYGYLYKGNVKKRCYYENGKFVRWLDS